MKSKKNNKYWKRKLSVVLCLLVLGICTACSESQDSSGTADKNEESEKNGTVKEKVQEPEKESEPVLLQPEEENTEESETDEVQTNEKQENENQSEEDPEHQVEELLDSLSIEEKVAQLFVVLPEQLVGNVSRVTAAGEATRETINNRPVGGIVYLESNLVSPEQTKTMLQNVQQYSMECLNLPIFLCVDEEGGQVTRLAGKAGFDLPVYDNMSVIGSKGDTEQAYQMGESIGQYLYDLGFNTDFAPVADVLTNPNNQVVRYRSFGSNPETVKNMTDAVSRGLASKKILATYKHFPGHGNTTADTHAGYAYSNKTKEELYQCELIPFIQGIEDEVPFIMMGHISLPNVVGDDTPASLSKTIVTDLLSDELGYKGIIITDALNMGAVSQQYTSAQAAVKALNAGVDMLLMPADFNAAYQGILAAVQSGEISEERIDESVEKILKTKVGMLEE